MPLGPSSTCSTLIFLALTFTLPSNDIKPSKEAKSFFIFSVKLEISVELNGNSVRIGTLYQGSLDAIKPTDKKLEIAQYMMVPTLDIRSIETVSIGSKAEKYLRLTKAKQTDLVDS